MTEALKGYLNIAGQQGPKGPKGDPGPGMPAGGTTGQMLIKQSSTDFDYAWADLMQTKSTLDTPLDYTIPYDIGTVSSLPMVLPATAGGDGSICVIATAANNFTATVTGTYEGDNPTIHQYVTGHTYCFVYYWNRTIWHLDIVDMTEA